MNEYEARTLLDRAAAGEAPPSPVDVGLAIQRGRRTMRNRRLLVVGAAAMAVLIVIGGGVVGATWLAGSRQPVPPGGTPTTIPSMPTPSAGFCRVDLPDAWRQALASGLIKHQPDESLIVKAVMADGGGAFAESFVNGKHTVVALDPAGTSRRTVMTLSKPDQQVFGAAFDGHWLVLSVTDETTVDSPWTMYAWDASGAAAARRIGQSNQRGPFPYPLVYKGQAFWSQAISAERSELHRYDLSTATDRVIHTGTPNYPFQYAEMVVWPEMVVGDASAPATLLAADAATGQPTELPRSTNTYLAGAQYRNADADTFVWSSNDLATLEAWHGGDATPTTIIAQAPTGTHVQWPQVANELVSWDDSMAQFVADLRSGSYAQLTPEAGSVLLKGDAMVVQFAPSEKSDHPVLSSALLRPSQLPPLPTCR